MNRTHFTHIAHVVPAPTRSGPSRARRHVARIASLGACVALLTGCPEATDLGHNNDNAGGSGAKSPGAGGTAADGTVSAAGGFGQDGTDGTVSAAGGATQDGSAGATSAAGGATQDGSGGTSTGNDGATQDGSGGTTSAAGGASQDGAAGTDGSGAAGAGGSSLTCSKGAATLAGGQSNPSSLAIDATDVYWTAYGAQGTDGNLVAGAGQVLKVARNGGTPIVLASGLDRPSNAVVDDSSVYWSDATGIHRLPKSGGTPTTISDDRPIGFGLRGGQLFWATTSAVPSSTVVKTAASTDGVASTLAQFDDDNNPITRLALNSHSVLLASFTSGQFNPDGSYVADGALESVADADGAANRVFNGLIFPLAMTADDDYALLFDQGQFPGDVVLAVTLANGATRTLGTELRISNEYGISPTEFTISLAMDATSFYFNDGKNGAIVKAPKAGGTASTLTSAAPPQLADAPLVNGHVPATDGVTGLAVDGDVAYWLDARAGTVRRMCN